MKKIYLLPILLLVPQLINAASISDYSPVSHYDLDEESGVRYDSVGVNNLTDNNTVLFGTGVLDNAADFVSSNSEFLSITDGSQTGFDLTGDFSLSSWVNFDSVSVSYTWISKFTGSGNQRSYSLGTNSAVPSIQFCVSDDGTDAGKTCVHENWSPSTSTWYHVCLAYDASAGSSYTVVNGTALGTQTGLKTSVYNGTAPFMVSSFNGGGPQYFDGLIDSLTIVDGTVFDYDDCNTLYNSGTPLSYEESTATTTNPKLIPYNENMPLLETVVCESATCTLTYATSTVTYFTLSNFLYLTFYFFGIIALVAFVTRKLL